MVIPTTILFNDRVCFITFYKVGSRATVDLFNRFTNQENIIKAEIKVDENFKLIDDDISHIGKQLAQIEKDKVRKELNNIFLEKTEKDIIILYRDPSKRFLTGIIEEFSFSLKKYFDNDNYNTIISDVINSLNFNGTQDEYESILERKGVFVLNQNYSRLSKNESDFYKKLFYEYINELSKRSFNTGHTYHYLTPLFLLLETNEAIKNNRKIKLLNLDLDKNKLQETLLGYGSHGEVESIPNSTSNSLFVDFANELIFKGQADWDKQKLKNSISRYLMYENIGYKKLINNPKNI